MNILDNNVERNLIQDVYCGLLGCDAEEFQVTELSYRRSSTRASPEMVFTCHCPDVQSVP